ncbi:MAG: PD40 domain-containing protein [Bacteroidales bacterium]|nr:PD40 domain-containing protein [Bacteroidales bacterium]
MKELVKIVLVLAFLLSLCVGNLSAQYAKLVDSKKYSKTEMSLFNASVGYFEVGDYTNAYMGFSQLHSWYASDPVFSYYCGASMVMLRNEYDKAIKYLTLAYDNNLYEADYYLGLAYHRKYLFSKSITFYSRYRDYLVQATKGKSPKIAEVEALMGKANKARTLGQESYVLKVISNNKVKRSNFHFSYGRKILDGNLVVKPDFFRQRNDKNNKDIDLVYVLDTIAFVSSYGNDMKTGLDLYVSHKTDEGWSPLQLLPGMVNTDYDEAFPFLSSDGVLYFASKGHNSIGGYDIFKSEYDFASRQWGNPENLGFPINTPYDDFMYAIESNGNSAFFASDRSSKDGQVMVCRYIVEEIPEKIHIETEEHLAEQAELPITPGAEAEYNRILQEQKGKEKEELQDSVVENQEIKQEQDTSDLYVTTKSMLEKKVSAVSNYQDYSKKLNAYARITSNKIRAIRNGESDADMSSSDITKMANSVVTCYDLSQKFNSVYSTAKPTLDYCTKEMSFLDKLETGGGEYQFKLQNLNVSVEKVNAKSPLETLIEEKKNERKQADDALKKLSRNMGKIQRSLRDINNDLEAKMLAIQNETDPMLREKYINEHKALENSKIDVISSKKNMDIEAKRLNAMMARANETLKMLEDIEDILANLDLSELDETEDIGANDILALQNFISDEDNKEIAEYEKEVENDESLYSEKIDYEAIAANSSSALTDIVNEVSEYKDDMSKSTSAVVGMIVQSDSLYSQKSRFEVQFDAADSDEEKKDLLDKINATQKQIVEKGKAIESGLVYESNPLVSKAIDDFNSIKQEKINSSDWPELVSSTQNLIEKSRKLESQISESKSEANVGVDKAKLLEKIKSDIDNQIVGNVEEMQGIVVAQQSGKKDIASMNAEIAKIRSSAKDKTAESEVKKDLNSASKKVLESKQGDSNSVAILNDAENILVGAVEKRIAILTEEYEAESKVYDVLAGKYVRSKSTENQKQQADVIYYSALEERQQAESATDEVEKMKYLSEANKKLKSANSALLQVVSPDSKSETQQKDVLTQDILSLYDDIKEQKDVSSHTESVDLSHILSNTNQSTEPVEVKGNETSIQNAQQNGVAEGSGNTIPPQSLQHSVTLQTDLTKRISTNNDDITTIATNLATASRTEKKRLQTELGEVISERDGNVRTLGEEKQHFYSELDKVINEEISKTTVSAEYANRYADYRQSLYSLINADSSFADMTEKLADAEKSEYALLQTIIPNVNDGMAAVLIDIYSVLDDKYGVALSTELAESTNPNRIIANSNEVQNVAVSNSQSVIESNNPSFQSPTEPVDPSRPLSVAEGSGNETSIQNAQQNGVVEGAGSTISSQSLQHSVTLQADLTKRISTNNDDITTIANNMATANHGEKKRLETFLGEVTAERNDNVRTLGEEKQRFYAELDKSKHDDIVKTSASADYTNRYADYRQSLYSLTNADPSAADMTEKLAEAEKSEYALLQTIIPNVDSETKSVLMPIYNSLDAKYGNLASANSTNYQSGVEGKNNENTTTSPQSLQHSVTLQTDLTKRISTNNDDITTIATNMATVDRGEKKRLQTFLGEVTAERNDNVRTLGEEKQRFYAELDKSKHDDIAKTSASTDYTNRYADYLQSLYSLTNADLSAADMTEKLAEAEKSEYALLQTIIPNVDAETSIVLVQIYSELDAKYGNTSPAEPVEASASSLAQNATVSTSQRVIVSNNPSSNPPAEPVDPSRPLSVAEGSGNETSIQNDQQNGVVEGSGRPISSLSLQHSVTLQTDLTKRISTNNDDITTIATNMATADRGEKKRLETFLGEVTAERNGNVRTLGEEKQRFYAELDKSKHDDIAKTRASTDYTNRYADYRQSLYTLTNADLSAADMTEKLAEAEKSEYALLQTIIPNVDTETSIVLVQIYSELDAKYGNTSPAKPVEASVSSTAQNDPMSNGQSVIVSNNPSYNPPFEPLDPSRPLSVVEGKGNDISAQNSQQNGVAKELDDNSAITTSVDSQQLKASVVRQSEISNRITINASEISAIEGVIAASAGSDKQRLQNELGEITAQRNSNVRSLSEEKQHFYAEIDKSVHDAIAKSDVSSEYTNRYTTYRQSLYNLANAEQSSADMSQKLAEAEKAEYALLQTIIPNADSETKSILLPVYNGLEAKYGTTGGVEIAGVVPETYSRSMTLQEQMVRNIEISTKEIERLEQRKEVAKKSEQRRIADDIAREESQKLDDIQKLAVEKSKFYSELNSSLETILPTLSDSARQEYKLAYDSYDETLRTMKIGLGFYDMSVANKIYSDSEIQEYKLLQQMSQVATGETKTVVDNMIGRMEANNSTLRRYKVVVDYVIVENIVNNASTNSNVAEKRDSVSLNIPDSNSTILASVDSTVVAPKKKSMSGFSADSYGIFEKPEINMGLYYRIQIVAANVKYRMPYFNGLSLIFTEQIPNTNIIRYMTGEYYRYVSAREDLPKVRGLGFSDAFIVAYYNGKRISIGEARRLEALQNAEENEEIPIVIRHEAPADYVEPESIIASSQTKTETIANVGNGASVANNSISSQSVTEENSAVSSENVAVNGQIVPSGNVVDSQGGIALDSHEIPSKGVYYAVQIGVYKDRRQPSQMKGVSPIDYETMPNGYIRHTSGRFGNYDQARASQANIRRQGISDAFVIAYIDGRKVSFSEAIEYQKSLESRVIAEANAENTTPKTQGVASSEENLSNVEYAPLNLNTGTEENNKEGISYYVQIGAFSKSPDPEILSVFSKVAGDKIHVKFPREGLQVYRIGVFNSYEEAQNTLAEARSFGIVDAFIVAFKGEEQISSSEAIRLQNAVRQIEGNSGETINNNVGQKSSQTNQPTSNAEPKPVVPAETLQQANGGVEYFVQLGAFVHTPDTRSMATFRAIATTSGSRLSTVQNGKFTNYRVGAFKKFDDVKAAVENARSMGVTDAFVVAFYNGERIPVVEAKEKE